MIYPSLPLSATAVSLFEQGLSPHYDIVWSLTYRVENATTDDELGICMFLQDATVSLSGGGIGIDLGYSGLSSYNASLSSSMGMLSGVIGIGLDSTGQFPLSVQWPDTTIRDGLNVSDRILNSVSVRGSYPDFNYVANSNTEITDFNIIESERKTLRARLGNYGRTIYLDYRRSESDDFINILTSDVNIPFTDTTRLRPGVSFTKPVSSTNSSTQQVVVEIFHAEGRDEDPVITTYDFEEIPIPTRNSTLPVDPNDIIGVINPPRNEVPPLPPVPPIQLPLPLPPAEYACGDIITAVNDDTVTSYTIDISGGTGYIPITFILPISPLSATGNIPISAISYEFNGNTTYGELSVNFLSSYRDEFASYNLNVGDFILFPRLDDPSIYYSSNELRIDNKLLLITGFQNYTNMCTTWVEESAFGSGSMSGEFIGITGTYCAEYSPTFTVILTGDYDYTGLPSGEIAGNPQSTITIIKPNFSIPKPVRFKIDYTDDPLYYDSYYVGSLDYNYGGSLRQSFIDSITSSHLSAEYLSDFDSESGDFEPDGFPKVYELLQITKNYLKETDSVRIKTTVYDPMSGKDWMFTIQCPTTAEESCVTFGTSGALSLDDMFCVSVIDESDSENAPMIQASWNKFTQQFPNRTLQVLQPEEGAYGSDLQIPQGFTGNIFPVVRDEGIVGNRDDWFDILNLSEYEGSSVAIAIDNSGSMYLDNVRASYNYFKERVSNAGLELFELDMGFSELWIDPFLTVIPEIQILPDLFLRGITTVCNGLAESVPSTESEEPAIPPTNFNYYFSDSGLGNRTITIPLSAGTEGLVQITTGSNISNLTVTYDGSMIPEQDTQTLRQIAAPVGSSPSFTSLLRSILEPSQTLLTDDKPTWTFVKVASADTVTVAVEGKLRERRRTWVNYTRIELIPQPWTFTLSYSGLNYS
jgi:hypothetical protein